jgi:hypothetical protein
MLRSILAPLLVASTDIAIFWATTLGGKSAAKEVTTRNERAKSEWTRFPVSLGIMLSSEIR